MHPFLIKLANRLKLLPYLNTQCTIDVNGKKLTLPILGQMGYQNLHLTEPFMTEVMLKLKPIVNNLFIDVGANLGQTLLKAYSVFGNMQYIGFEPNPTCLHYLQELIKANEFRNCTLLPAGLSSQTEVLKLNFYFEDTVDSSASIIPNFRPNQPVHHSVYVPVFNPEAFAALWESRQPGSPLLKIDVEGAELEVLTGLSGWIEACGPVILAEVLPAYSSENNFRITRQKQIEKLLLKWNYQIAWIKKTGTARIVSVDEIPIHSDPNDSDFIFYPRRLKPQIDSSFSNGTIQ